MALAKLMAASRLENNMTKETWAAAGLMDQNIDKV